VVGVHSVIRDDRPFSTAILKAKESGSVPLIADIKPVSPRDGDLVRRRTPARLAQSLAEAGACALSVVTEQKHFGGCLRILKEVAQAVSIPVLRKDFFSSLQEIDQSREAGAAAVLLIMATIPEHLVSDLYKHARELGMEAVVEIHTRPELDQALGLSPTIIGINNRDILKLEKDQGDVRVTEELAPLVPDNIVTISESSLRTPDEIRRAIGAGADAVLVGTALLQADDPASCLADLTSKVEM
jgi:indole-3-glycerol phosphate synthase